MGSFKRVWRKVRQIQKQNCDVSTIKDVSNPVVVIEMRGKQIMKFEPGTTRDQDTGTTCDQDTGTTRDQDTEPGTTRDQDTGTTRNQDTDKENKQNTENLEEQIDDLHRKNEYLSTNIIETNSHLLSIYKRLRSLETESRKLENFRKENVFLFQKMKQVEDENIILKEKFQEFTDSNKKLVDEVISMQHTIEKYERIEEELGMPKNKIGIFENTNSNIKSLCQSIPLYTKSQLVNKKYQNPEKKYELETMMIRYMLPSIITVAAIVMNMYLYLSTNKNFPI